MQWIRPQDLPEIRANAKKWKDEREKKDRLAYEQMSREYGVKITCYGDVLAEIDRLDTVFRTCKLCGLVCSSTDKILAHNNSENCRKRIAEKKGITYVPKAKMPRFCPHCEVAVQVQSWNRHVQSKTHLNRVMMKEVCVYCATCNKDFSKKARPRRSYQNHLKNKVHLRKAAQVVISV